MARKRTITIPLSEDALNATIYDLRKYSNELRGKMQRLITAMCRHGEQYAISHVTRIDTGATVSSIHGYRKGNTGVIVAGGNAVWLEFGTGVYYNGNPNGSPHPIGAELGMVIGEYGKQHGLEQGWYWPTADPRYEIVRTKADGTEVHTGYGYTHGIEAQMFMWKTARELEKKCPELAKDIFTSK